MANFRFYFDANPDAETVALRLCGRDARFSNVIAVDEDLPSDETHVGAFQARDYVDNSPARWRGRTPREFLGEELSEEQARSLHPKMFERLEMEKRYRVDGNAPASLRVIEAENEDWSPSDSRDLRHLDVGESVYIGIVEIERTK